MICIIHGYLLDGSGSNLWTQSIIRTLCRAGQTVHLMCQEPHPERFDYVAEAWRYDEALTPSAVLQREVPYPGRCIMHKPQLGPVLPVYVWDKYEEFEQVVPMAELDDATLEDYIERNVALLDRLVQQHPIRALHVNHAVLMSVVAQRVGETHRIPFTIMPHGSAIEYAVKKDDRLRRHAMAAFAAAGRVFVIGPEIRQRVTDVFSELEELPRKLVDLNLGVDTGLFEPLEPGQRAASVEQLGQALDGVERGKSEEQSRTMRRSLSDAISRDALRRVLGRASDYTAKHTDVECEQKLSRLDWEHERMLLFVGRLIASKGIQAVVAALPTILSQVPEARLLVVGHGPLREPLEALLWALDSGSRTLLQNIIQWGSALEGATRSAPLEHLARYLELLEQRGELEHYLESARELHISDRVIFTGYLTHRELRHLFPCCDVAIFPSIVAEAGPLVFLEALASGVFPMGIDFAGMGASIDSVAQVLPAEAAELMRLSTAPERTVDDIARNAVAALALGRRHVATLRQVAVSRYDWSAVGQTLLTTLEGLA